MMAKIHQESAEEGMIPNVDMHVDYKRALGTNNAIDPPKEENHIRLMRMEIVVPKGWTN